MAGAWDQEEVDLCVDAYFSMLHLELDGADYSKAEHRRELMTKIDRSNGSIEFKFQNISAVMMEIGAVPIPGYKPAVNVQGLLRTRVAERFEVHHALRRSMLQAVEGPAEVTDGFLGDAAAPPDGERLPRRRARIGQVRDYQAMEAANRTLGLAGESLVVRSEKRRLTLLGHRDLADRVEHVSQTQGDGLGYDVLSWTIEGTERFLEVKTTRFNEFQPFLVSRNEVEFSDEEPERFSLVRVFGFDRPTRAHYELSGSLLQTASLRSELYSGVPARPA